MARFLGQTMPHAASAPSLELEGVSVNYERTNALSQVTFRLNRGDRVAVVGPNGAGKSTLFNVIAGVMRPDRGTVRIYGSDPSGHVCVGYVPQRNRIDLNFPATVADVVMMGRVRRIGLFRWPAKQDHAVVKEALARVGMENFAKRQIGELSGGQQQRVFLARALAQEAELLLMDEPLTGLDLPSQEAIVAILNDLQQQGVTILLATHDLNQAATEFPLVLLINRRLVGFGAPAEVFTPERLLTAYGDQMQVVHTATGDLLLADTCCSGGHTASVPIGMPYGAGQVMPPTQADAVRSTLVRE